MSSDTSTKLAPLLCLALAQTDYITCYRFNPAGNMYFSQAILAVVGLSCIAPDLLQNTCCFEKWWTLELS